MGCCGFWFGDVCMLCVVATSSAVWEIQHSSSQTLLLATALSCIHWQVCHLCLQPWKLSHHTYTLQKTLDTTCRAVHSIPLSIIVLLLKPSAHVSSCFVSPLLVKLWQLKNWIANKQYQHCQQVSKLNKTNQNGLGLSFDLHSGSVIKLVSVDFRCFRLPVWFPVLFRLQIAPNGPYGYKQWYLQLGSSWHNFSITINWALCLNYE